MFLRRECIGAHHLRRRRCGLKREISFRLDLQEIETCFLFRSLRKIGTWPRQRTKDDWRLRRMMQLACQQNCLQAPSSFHTCVSRMFTFGLGQFNVKDFNFGF